MAGFDGATVLEARVDEIAPAFAAFFLCWNSSSLYFIEFSCAAKRNNDGAGRLGSRTHDAPRGSDPEPEWWFVEFTIGDRYRRASSQIISAIDRHPIQIRAPSVSVVEPAIQPNDQTHERCVGSTTLIVIAHLLTVVTIATEAAVANYGVCDSSGSNVHLPGYKS